MALTHYMVTYLPYVSSCTAPCDSVLISTDEKKIQPSTEDLARVDCPNCLLAVKAIAKAYTKHQRALRNHGLSTAPHNVKPSTLKG